MKLIIDFQKPFREQWPGNGTTVDLDSLVDADQVWRGVHAGFQAGIPQYLLDEGTGGPLALRPGNVDRVQLVQIFGRDAQAT